MTEDRPIPDALKAELSDWRRWVSRVVVLTFAALAGLSVVLMTRLSEHALDVFFKVQQQWFWAPLLWTPLCTVAVVWCTRRWFAGAAGSGIPQVMAALDPEVPPAQRRHLVSLRLALGKIGLTSAGLMAGLSIGREGPSVQVAAGVMHHARRWLPKGSGVKEHELLVAGGAAGIAAAFNTPLGGVMFAIEELSRHPEQRRSGLLVAAIVLAGLIAVSIDGNGTYFGVIKVQALTWALLLPGLLVALSAGLLGGLFSRLLIRSFSNSHSGRFSLWRRRYPLRFAAACAFGVALIGLATGGLTFGSGYDTTKQLLDGQDKTPGVYVALRFLATWLSAWSGVPGGIFAPCLTIGAGIGSDIANLTGHPSQAALIALGMAGFLAAVTQAPITAFIIVMEMVDGHSMVLSLMACALTASGVARLLSPPLYGALTQNFKQAAMAAQQAATKDEEMAESRAQATHDASPANTPPDKKAER
ncbi:MAG: chloride channel protein [Rubrivivax sp.]|nr:MAG: chloride channel protein [Rubrivivax sp.]